MYQENIIDMLMQKMIRFNQNDPQRIDHLIKVHSFAQMIGRMEQLYGHSQFLTECAALVHDIGIRPAEEKYGMSNGRLQEQEGPFYARKMLGELGFEEADINRICYLVGHHHTYVDIDGIDYQILVEADFLVNFYEDNLGKNIIETTLQKILAGYGKVALSVMIPVLSHLRFETFNLPTALVSNTLDYGQFDILDTTEYMENTLLVWKKLMFSFDAICTGFIVSERQSSLVYEYCKEQQKSGTSIFVVPIMGDDGKRYNGVTNQVVTYMKRLCSIADVIVPNITEACFLSEYTVKHTYSEPEIEVIANRLHTLGAKSVVITSANINGRMFTDCSRALFKIRSDFGERTKYNETTRKNYLC